MREFKFIDMETGESESFLLNPEDVELLENYAAFLSEQISKNNPWSVVEVLAHSVRLRGIESLKWQNETPAGGAARDQVNS